MNYRTPFAAGAIAAALALTLTQANACEPRATVALAVADNYASRTEATAPSKVRYTDPVPVNDTRQFGGTLARIALGMDCGIVVIYAEHLSSLDTGQDEGMNSINVELDLLDLFDAVRGE